MKPHQSQNQTNKFNATGRKKTGRHSSLKNKMSLYILLLSLMLLMAQQSSTIMVSLWFLKKKWLKGTNLATINHLQHVRPKDVSFGKVTWQWNMIAEHKKKLDKLSKGFRKIIHAKSFWLERWLLTIGDRSGKSHELNQLVNLIVPTTIYILKRVSNFKSKKKKVCIFVMLCGALPEIKWVNKGFP